MVTNGRLDTRTLTKVDGWAYLAKNTAAAWDAACDEMVELGYKRPSITAPDGAYRTYDQQVYWKKYWTDRGKPGNASAPGFSGHGWGTDVDIWNVYQYPRAVLVPVFAEYGFTFNVPSELWHVRHNGVAPAGGTSKPIIEEEEVDVSKDILIRNSDTGAVVFANLAGGMWVGLAQGYPELLAAHGLIENSDGMKKPNVNVPGNVFGYLESIAKRPGATVALGEMLFTGKAVPA